MMLLLSIPLLTTPASAADPEPEWIGPVVALAPEAAVRFTGTLDLPASPDRALVRVAAYDHYRLLVNGEPVSIGDTPWDAETYDVTRLLRPGPNTVAADVASGIPPPSPRNCWLWLRRTLDAPGRFDRLTFATRAATADEWVYVEVLDADGHSSGLYCLERGKPDLRLGTSGAAVEHTLDLLHDQRLDYQGSSAECDFTRVAAVGIRVDRKEALEQPAGHVEFLRVRLEGERTVELGGAGGWHLERGSGEHRRSTLSDGPDGALVLRYDFTPAADASLALDLRAWAGGRAIARLATGPGWQAAGEPARVTPSPADVFSWTRLSPTGPDERPAAPCDLGLTLDFRGLDRGVEGEALPARVRAWALRPEMAGSVDLRAEDWSGREVLSIQLPLIWRDAEGTAAFETPALPRGLYRFTVSAPGQPAGERHTALAILAPGEARLRTLYDTLTPLDREGSLQGLDLAWDDSPALLLGLRDQGVNFLQVHIGPSQLDNGEFDDLLAFCQATGLRFAVNNEAANWSATAPAPDGHDRFVAANGCHRWDLEASALDRAAATGLFEGVVYDEGEHMQLCRNFYSKLPDPDHRPPYLVETTGLSLPEAHAAFTDAARTVAEYNRSHGARMLVESVFPVLWHPLAAAGVTLCPKLLKEDINPVVLAMALGAARQYDAELWFSPDFWWYGWFPGHSVEDYAAALRLAYRAGVDNVYTEGVWALCRPRGAVYDLTDYGVALREHLRWRAEQPPRGYTYRDYEPEVAIIRFPDSDWGQASCYYWKTLYGTENLPPTPETGEWMQVWSLLTAGQTDPRAVNANSSVYPRDAWQFTYPAPAVAVYDHLVGEEPLRTVRTFFLCGITISEPTLAAVRRRVQAGATCFAVARLCPADIRDRAGQLPARVSEGKGSWIVVGGFTPEDLGDYVSRVPRSQRDMELHFANP